MSHLVPAIAAVHEVQALRQELADTRKKLQDYADTIVSLHGELRTLRDGICKSCKRKFHVPASLVSPQAVEPAVDPSSLINFPQKPQSTKTTFPWRHTSQTFPPLPILPAHIPPPAVLTATHGNETRETTSKPLIITTSGKVIPPNTVPSIPRWSTKRDVAVNAAAVDVTFVRAFDHKGRVRSVRFSADGKYLSAVLCEANKNGVIFIYDVETGEKNCELAEYASQYSSTETPGIYCVCFSPNGRYLVVGDHAGRVIVWDIPNKRIRNIFKGHVSVVESVDFSPNGRLVASASSDWTVCLWNMRDGSARVFTDNAYVFCSVRFSPNGQFVAAGNTDGIMRVWDVRTGQLMRKWTGHEDTVRSVAFTPDGRILLSGGNDGDVKCWDVSSLGIVLSDGGPVATKILECKDQTVCAIAVSPDGQLIASGLYNGRTVIWDAHSAIQQFRLIGHEHAVYSVDFSLVGSYLALGSYDCQVTLWRYRT